MKKFFELLKKEFTSKKKELTVLLLVNLFELFALSSLLMKMPVWAVILVTLALLVPALVLIVMCVRDRKADKQDIKILFLFIALALLFGIVKSYLYVISLMIAYLFYDDRHTMYKWLFIISSSALVLWIILSLFQVLPDNAMIRYDGPYHDISHVRHTFGFNHPNHVLKYVLATSVFGYMCLGDNKKHLLIFSAIVLALTLWLGWLTNCRTGMLVITGLLVIMNVPILVSWFKTKRLLFVFIFLSFAMIAFRSVPEVNQILSGRPFWFNKFFVEFPQHVLFGKYYLVNILTHFSVDAFVSYPLDNEFLMIIFDGGLIALLVLTYLFFMGYENNEDTKTKVALIGLFMYGLTEAFELAFTYPFYIMLFIELIDMYYKKKENIKLFKENKKIENTPAE